MLILKCAIRPLLALLLLLPGLAAPALLMAPALLIPAPALAQIGVNEYLPRRAPVLKRFSVVAITANNQCLTAQLAGPDISRLRPEILLSPCEFSIDSQTQGFFIGRATRERNQLYFAANPAYCLAMDPGNRRLVTVPCAVNAEMMRSYPQFFDLQRGGLSLDDDSGQRWCLDTRAREGFSQVFEPYFISCPGQNADGFLLRVNR
ncbi:hypothetical protein [Ferrovibrio sp.]|uniref:hypothetical protein n=1 Tax=Ferrovibrio sp. TaxID=1917215 RepID=UPI0025C0D240|nr:hypothetical protein [Ferrovibrio sp.]MBX3455718.1 hypothetical protein [Ferrovibrio sp.]